MSDQQNHPSLSKPPLPVLTRERGAVDRAGRPPRIVYIIRDVLVLLLLNILARLGAKLIATVIYSKAVGFGVVPLVTMVFVTVFEVGGYVLVAGWQREPKRLRVPRVVISAGITLAIILLFGVVLQLFHISLPLMNHIIEFIVFTNLIFGTIGLLLSFVILPPLPEKKGTTP